MSDDDRFSPRPRPRALEIEPDEDAEPRPLRLYGVDLSGDYRVEPFRWIAYGAGKWGKIAGAFVGFLVIMILGSLFCGQVFQLLFRSPMACGAFLVAVRALRDERWSPQTFHEGFGVFGWLFLSTLLNWSLYAGVFAGYFLMQIAVEAGGLDSDVAAAATVALAILNALLALSLQVRWSFANSLIVEQHMPIGAALAASWRMTHGHVLGLAFFYLLLGLLFVAGLLMFGVGLFFTVPLISLAEASAYLHATGQVKPPPARSPATPPASPSG